MPISFEKVPRTSLIPWAYIEFDNTGTVLSSAQSYKILLIGQKLDVGEMEFNRIVTVYNESQAIKYFGQGSMLHMMFKACKANNSMGEVNCVAVDDVKGIKKAQKKIKFNVNDNVVPGLIKVYLGGQQIIVESKRVKGKIALGQLLKDLQSAINNNVLSPFKTVSIDEADKSVLLEAKHPGELYNDIDIRFNYYDDDTILSGMSISVENVVAGDGNPNIEDVMTKKIGDNQYHVIALPFNDEANYIIMDKVLTDKWGPQKQSEGIGVYALAEQQEAAIIKKVSKRNSFLMVCDATWKSPTPSYIWAAAKSGQIAREAELDPARPFQTLELVDVLPPVRGEELKMSERNQLLKAGVSTHTVDYGGKIRTESLVTNYTKSPSGAPDPSYQYLNTILTLSYIRWDQRNFLLKKYPRYKLASDNTPIGAGQKVLTPKILKAELVGKFREWEKKGLVENSDRL